MEMWSQGRNFLKRKTFRTFKNTDESWLEERKNR